LTKGHFNDRCRGGDCLPGSLESRDGQWLEQGAGFGNDDIAGLLRGLAERIFGTTQASMNK
jgi:hypothetical protein